MTDLRRLAAALVFLCLAPAAMAQTHHGANLEADLGEFAGLVAPPADGAVSWALLATARSQWGGPEVDYVTQLFYTPELEALDGQTIKVTGFIYPLEADGDQTHFLITALPPDCPFCLPAGPGYMIEAFSENGVPFSYDPVTLEGKMEIIRDGDYGLYYKLHDVRLAS